MSKSGLIGNTGYADADPPNHFLEVHPSFIPGRDSIVGFVLLVMNELIGGRWCLSIGRIGVQRIEITLLFRGGR